jgi:AraC-like DNA-binding protein
MITRGTLINLCRARDMLREVHDRPVSIREVARDAGMSPFHFIRQFQSVFGNTPHQFRIQARLDRAKNLLALSDYSVTDVCMEIGFSSLGTFSDLFARRVGATPSEYRRRVRSLICLPGTLPIQLTPGCLTLMGAAFAIFEKQERAILADAGRELAGHGARRQAKEDSCGSNSPASWSTIRIRR